MYKTERKVFISTNSSKKLRVNYFRQGIPALGEGRGFYQENYLTSVDQKIPDYLVFNFHSLEKLKLKLGS